MRHAPNSLGCLAAEYRFTAMKTHRCGNLLNPHGLALDIEDFVDLFLTALSLSAHMTADSGT
jgi:hypothetical protein